MTTEDVSPKDVTYFTGKKSFLGGYRNKITGEVYHHAKVQTLPSPWKYRNIEKFHRTTQTVDTKDKCQQTPYDSSTQTECPRLYLSSEKDKILPATNWYIYADEIKKAQLMAIIIIQKYWRRWLAKQELDKRKRELLDKILWDVKQDRLRAKEESDWLKSLARRRKTPRTKDDFALAFGDLKEWWEKQVEDLKASQSGPTLKASLGILLDKEVEKIHAIENERQKAQAVEELKKKYRFLSKTAAAKVWKAYKLPISVENEATQKAKALQSLYITICQPSLVREDRIAALLQLKDAVSVYNCPLTTNIAMLANREIDLLTRGIKEKNLHGLRNRIRNLVWQFSHQPAFNPEAQRLSKAYHFFQNCKDIVIDLRESVFLPKSYKFPLSKFDRIVMDQSASCSGELTIVNDARPHVFNCSSCNQYFILPPHTLDEAVGFSVLQGRFMKCKNCKYLENEGWIRKENEIYKRMLKLLKSSEAKHNTKSGIVYLLQPGDIAYLAEKIWKAQSCLSGLTVLKDLEFARWNVEKNWTPWNCLLLTRDEAIVHSRMDNNKTVYDEKFVHSVYLKHLEARQYFSTIPRYLPYLSITFSWSDYAMQSVDEARD